jgi:hypothetical protein
MSILGGQNHYMGVHIVPWRDKLMVFDGTQPAGQHQINPWDLAGQPIWTGPLTIQFKTVMRGDIAPNDTVTLPKTLATLGGQAVNPSGQQDGQPTNIIQGSFLITGARHTGRFRQPDWQSWVSTFDARKSQSSSLTGGPGTSR